MLDNCRERNTYVIILNNTERSMCENAIMAVENGLHPRIRNTEGLFESTHLIDTIKEEVRGFRVVVSKDDLDLLSSILRWYEKFSPTTMNGLESSTRKYAILGVSLELRNQHMRLFDFDPKFLMDGTHSNVKPFEILHTRFLLVRHCDKLVDFFCEMIQYSDESDSDYRLRINNVVTNEVHCNESQIAEIVSFQDIMENFKITDDSTYAS